MKRTQDAPALIVTPHPITLDRQQSYGPAVLIPGETLASLLGRHGVQAGQGWVASIGGVPVPEITWHLVRPKDGHVIEARSAAHNRDILRVVAVAVLSYYTLGAGATGSGGWAAGMSAGTAMAWGTVAYIAGSIVINKLLGPKNHGIPGANNGNTPTTYNISGAKNNARPYEPLGLVLGEPYCVPDIAAQPYTYFEGDEQYLWQVFNLGINCGGYEGLRIGQTAIESYSDVRISTQGFTSGDTGLARPSNVTTTAGATLSAPSGVGPWTTRTSALNTGLLSVDMEANIFAVDATTGAYKSRLVEVEMQYRALGAPDWETFAISSPEQRWIAAYTYYETNPDGSPGARVDVPAVEYTYTPNYVELISASTKPLRRTFSRQVDPGQYEVRMRKRTEDTSSSRAQNVVAWSALKSYQADSNTYAGQALLGIQVRASGQLSGALNEVNCRAIAAPMPYWDGADWTTATDRASGLCNPGAILLLLARGIYDTEGKLMAGLGLDDAYIDIESFQDLMVRCADKDLSFSHYQQGQISNGDLMEQVAYSAMAAISWHTGKFGVISFEEDEPQRGVLNMAALSASSFSVTYDTAETADELEVQFFDREAYTWKTLRITAPGVDSPDNTGRLTLTGVDSEVQASVLGRFAMAQNLYQRKTIQAAVDLEHLTFRRGTVLALSHDMTQWGYGGRVQAAVEDAGVVTITLDEPVPAVGPDGQITRYIGLRLRGERQYRIFGVESFVGESREIVLSEAWPGGVDLPGESSPAHDVLWIYDFKSTPGQLVRVASIDPTSNLAGARVSFVPESEEFWDYVWTGDYTPPPVNTLLQGLPVISNAVITERLLLAGNVFQVEVTITFDVAGSYSLAELRGAVVSDDEADVNAVMTGTVPTQALGQTTSATVSFVSAGLSDRWLLKLTPMSMGGLPGEAVYLDYTVRGKSAPPADVSNFRINGLDLSWSPVPDVDVAGYVIRYNSAASTWWPTATPAHDGLITESPYALVTRPSGVVTFLIKAVDTSGNESENAASVMVNLGDTSLENIVFRVDEHPDFTGTITGGSVDGGVLVADDLDEFFSPPDAPAFEPANEGAFDDALYGQMIYEWTFDAPSSGTVTLEHTIVASGMVIEFRMGDQSLAFVPETDDAFTPADEPFFGEPGTWQLWPGSLILNGEQEIGLRITLEGGGTRGEIHALTTVMDVVDVIEYLNDVDIAPGGTRIALTKEYRFIKYIGLSLQTDGGDGIGVRVVDKDTFLGPLLEVVDATNSSVAGVVDLEIQGY